MSPAAPEVIDLDDPAAINVGLTGGKAAALARAQSDGLPTDATAPVTAPTLLHDADQ